MSDSPDCSAMLLLFTLVAAAGTRLDEGWGGARRACCLGEGAKKDEILGKVSKSANPEETPKLESKSRNCLCCCSIHPSSPDCGPWLELWPAPPAPSGDVMAGGGGRDRTSLGGKGG